jgi:RES domain-containing protein
MPRLYRLVRKKYARPGDLLTGQGAALVGGRWNEKGTRLVYTTSHASLALVEALVHSPTLPKDMILVAVDVPDQVAMGRWQTGKLPSDWATYPSPASTQLRGTRWAKRGRELGVWVPSAVVPAEWNCLLNPLHPDMALVTGRVLGPFRFDPRLRP